jgi:ribonuclease D
LPSDPEQTQHDLPAAAPPGLPQLIDTAPAFSALVQVLAEQPAIAIDTESDSLYRYFHRVCLIQISTRSADYLIDPLRLADLAGLGGVMADPAIEKVFHAAENDVLLLKRDFGFIFANVSDTMLAARILGWPRVGLAALLEQHFDIHLDKRTQLTDWGRRPLTPEQLRYAALDSHYLLPLRDLQERELRARKRWREAQEAFADLPGIVYTERPFDPDGFWHSKGARDLSPSEMAVLRALYLWRDGEARRQNCPPFKVMNEEIMARLSREQPRRLTELPHNLRRHDGLATSVLAAVTAGRAAPPPVPPRRPANGDQRPDPAAVARFDQLRAWRAARALERGVEPDVVMNNQSLMAIARAAPAGMEQLAAMGVLGPWKLEEYGDDLLHVIGEA